MVPGKLFHISNLRLIKWIKWCQVNYFFNKGGRKKKKMREKPNLWSWGEQIQQTKLPRRLEMVLQAVSGCVKYFV
jgi:hypothetical protein